MNKNVFFLCDFVKTKFVSFQFNQNINTDPFISFLHKNLRSGCVGNGIRFRAHA